MAGLRRYLARTPLWLRLVSATLLMVTLAITLTGLFRVRLLRGYLVERVDQQLRARQRAVAGRSAASLSRSRAHARSVFFGLFHSVLVDSTGAKIRTMTESTETHTPRLPRLTSADVALMAGQPFTVDSQDPQGPYWRAVAMPGRDGDSRIIAISLGDLDDTGLPAAAHRGGRRRRDPRGARLRLLLARTAEPAPFWGRSSGPPRHIADGDLSRRVPTLVGHHRGRQARPGPERHARPHRGGRARARGGGRVGARVGPVGAALGGADPRFMADASHELRTPLTSIGVRRAVPARGATRTRRIGDPAAEPDRGPRRRGWACWWRTCCCWPGSTSGRELGEQPVDVLSLAAHRRGSTPRRSLRTGRSSWSMLYGSEGAVFVTGDEPGSGRCWATWWERPQPHAAGHGLSPSGSARATGRPS